MTTIQAFIKRHPVLIYFVLTLALSWGGVLSAVGTGLILGATEIAAEQLPLVYLTMLIGPSVAGILVIGLVEGRGGLRTLLSRLLRWRVGAAWWVIALLATPLLMFAVLLALSRFSPEFLPVIFKSDDKMTLLLTGIGVGLLVGFFEELGWTGFAIPQLRLRYGVLASGLSVGLMWGAWHFPLFREGDSFSTLLGLALLIGQLFAWLLPYRVLMVWVYDRTESLLMVMLMHASLVASQDILFPMALTGVSALTYTLMWAAVLWVFVLAVAVANHGQIWRSPLHREMGAASR